jgi:hypothetical protein
VGSREEGIKGRGKEEAVGSSEEIIKGKEKGAVSSRK